MIEVNKGDCIVQSTADGQRKFDPKLKRIDFCGTRCYQRAEGVYYPSVTSILTACPVDQFFLQWLEEVGKNAEIIKNKAAREGTHVHEAMEDLAAGKVVEWQDGFGNAKYNLLEWQMILRGADFFNTYKPKILGSEQFLFSDKYQYAGTTDLLIEMPLSEDNSETWLIDYKTSNHVSKQYFMQMAAYAKAYEEQFGIHIDRAAVLWLKAATRTHSKKPGVYQGEGWQLIFSEDIEKDFEAFLKIYDIYKLYNPKIEPYTKSYPTEISLTM